jgi:hypothetical protein
LAATAARPAATAVSRVPGCRGGLPRRTPRALAPARQRHPAVATVTNLQRTSCPRGETPCASLEPCTCGRSVLATLLSWTFPP